MKTYKCAIDLTNPMHSVKVIDKNGNIEDVITTKFIFKGDSLVKKTFGVPIQDLDVLQYHIFEIFKNNEYFFLIRSISLKNTELELIPESKNSLVNIIAIPVSLSLDFATLFHFYFYEDNETLKVIALEKILEICASLGINTELELS